MAQAQANETKAVAEAQRLKCVQVPYACNRPSVYRSTWFYSTPLRPDSNPPPKNRQWIGERAKIKAEEAVHPMLGQLISDLGYKKVYCASVVRTLHVFVESMTGLLHRLGWWVDS